MVSKHRQQTHPINILWDMWIVTELAVTAIIMNI